MLGPGWTVEPRGCTLTFVSSNEWNALDARRGIWWREYEFTRGARATTVVLRGDDGLVVVSPSVNTPDAAFAELSAHGPVRALIATNSHHHMGQREWRARFPGATSYAPPRVVSVLGKKLPGVDVRPLTELAWPGHVRWEDAPGFKTGETFLRIATDRGAVWFVGDLLANIQHLPPRPMRWLFQWTNSAPGLKLFRLATWLFVADKREVRTWLLARLEVDPPVVLIPAHGPPADGPDLAARVRAEVSRL